MQVQSITQTQGRGSYLQVLQIILLHVLGQVINLHLKTKTSERSERHLLRGNTCVDVVKAYSTMGTQPKSHPVRGAGTSQVPNTAGLPDRLPLSERRTLLLPAQKNTLAWEHQGLM